MREKLTHKTRRDKMYEMYETQDLTHSKCKSFCNKFSSQIGTEYEISPSPSCHLGMYYVLCFEVTSKEAIICKKIEDS